MARKSRSIAEDTFVSKRKRKRLLDKISRGSGNILASLSTRDFEYLVVAYFRRQGFEIADADVKVTGIADFLAIKERERYLVSRRLERDGAFEVDDAAKLHGAVTEAGATGAIVVHPGTFTASEAAIARSHSIILMDGHELHARIRSFEEPEDIGRSKWRPVLLAGVMLLLMLGIAALLFTEQGRLLQAYIQPIFDQFHGQKTGEDQPRDTAVENRGKERQFTFSKEEIERAMEEVRLRKQQHDKGEAYQDQGQDVPVRYRYEIELHSGGWIYADDVRLTDTTLIYSGARGLEVSLNRDEVKTLKKVKVEK